MSFEPDARHGKRPADLELVDVAWQCVVQREPDTWVHPGRRPVHHRLVDETEGCEQAEGDELDSEAPPGGDGADARQGPRPEREEHVERYLDGERPRLADSPVDRAERIDLSEPVVDDRIRAEHG